MSARVNNGQPVNGATSVVNNADLSTAGNKLTYTCPAGKQAVVRNVNWQQKVAGGTLSVLASVGGVTVTLTGATASGNYASPIALNAADQVILAANATGAGATTDLLISADEYLAV